VAGKCFKKQDSSPPVCELHGVKLFVRTVAKDPLAPFLGHVIIYQCPVSGEVF